MIIELRQFGPGDFRATMKGDRTGITGRGDSPELAVGKLVYTWAGAEDSANATETIDVGIVARQEFPAVVVDGA